MAVIKRLNIEEVDNIQASIWVGFVQDSEKLDEDDSEKETARDGVVNLGEFVSEEPQSSSE